MADLAKLVVSLEAETRKYRQGMDRAQRRLDRFQRSQTRSLRSIEARFRNLGRVVGSAFGFFIGGSIATAIRNTAKQADELENLGRRLGVAADQLQAWQLVAERFNVTNQSLNTGIQRLQRRSAEAAVGLGEARGALRELGISAQSFNNLSLDDQILRLARAFETVETDADRTRLAFKLFDTEGVALLQFLKEGEQGLQALRRELDGQIWSEEERRRLSEANTSLKIMEQRTTLLAGSLSSLVLEGGDTFSTWLDEIREKINNLTGSFSGLLNKISRLGAFGLLGQVVASPAPEDDTPPPIVIDQGTDDPLDALARALDVSKTTKNDVDFAIEQGLEAAKKWEAIGKRFRNNVDFAIEQAIELGGALAENARQAEDAFTDLFVTNMVEAAEGGFRSILQSFSRTLQQMAAKLLASQVFRLLGFGNPGGGFLGLGKLFGGARADGGPVTGGRAFLVGERGPELFVPGSSGAIMPNGAGGFSIQQNITVNGASRGEMLVAAKAIEENTKAVVFDELRRSGRL